MTLVEFTQQFATPDACLQHLERIRWNGSPYCPHCGSGRKIYRFSDGRRYRCADCKHVFRAITGTLFGDSPIKLLPQFFLAVYFETTHSKGISSTQLAKHIGVTQKTAWFMLQRICNAMKAGDEGLLGGDVEIDETYLGGKKKNRHASQKKNLVRGPVGKDVAFAMKERNGQARAVHVASASGKDVAPVVLKNVAIGSQLHADDSRAYGALDSFYSVSRVNHSAQEYVNGKAHTNGIESLWAITKRVYIRTHHWWSNKHTQLYLSTICFRQNFKDQAKQAAVDALLRLGMDCRLSYGELTK